MRYRVLFAMLCAVLLATPLLWAQHGGGMAGGFGGHGGSSGGGHGFSGGAPHGGMSGVHGSPVIVGGWNGNGNGGWHGNGWNGGWHGNGWHGNGWRGNGWRGYPYSYRGYYPWWGYAGVWYPSYGWYGGFGYDYDYSDYGPDYDGPDGYAGAQPPDAYIYMTPQSSAATYASPGEAQKIQQQVDKLRAQQQGQQTSQAPESNNGTVLVYRDGYKETINNYAIVGNNVWVLNQSSAKKVPLSELDLTATKRDNEERGGDFVIPNASH